MNDKYEQYALLTAKMDEIENMRDLLKKDILEDMRARGAESEKHSLGKFTVSKVKKWTYPEPIMKAEESLKAEKAKAQSTGDATCEEADSLRFTSIKI